MPTLYRLLAFFQKYDILGRFHSDVLLDDDFAGFASNCANFAEINSDISFQESISGFKTALAFGDSTEEIALTHTLNPTVYANEYGSFQSPVLIEHKAAGMTANAVTSGSKSQIILPDKLSGYDTDTEFGQYNDIIQADNSIKPFISDPLYGSSNEIIDSGDLTVNSYSTTPAFGGAESPIFLSSSIKGTVTFAVSDGHYALNSNMPVPATDWIAEIPIKYSYVRQGQTMTSEYMRIACSPSSFATWAIYNAPSGQLSDILIALYYSGAWNGDLAGSGIIVLEPLTLTGDNAEMFARCFHLDE